MTSLNKGDRVRFTAAYLGGVAYDGPIKNGPAQGTLWKNRRGTVTGTGSTRGVVQVRWDGNRSSFSYPAVNLEKADGT